MEQLNVQMDVMVLSAIITPMQSQLWFVRILAAHPAAQARVQSELDVECGPPTGPDAPPHEMSVNRARLPYSWAVLWEVTQR